MARVTCDLPILVAIITKTREGKTEEAGSWSCQPALLLSGALDDVHVQFADVSLPAVRIALRRRPVRSSKVLIVRNSLVGATYRTTGL